MLNSNWATFGEGAKVRVVAEYEFVLGVVLAVEGKINVNLIATTPSRGRGTLHGFVVNKECGHDTHGWTVFVHTFSGRSSIWNLSESAENILHGVGDV